MKNDERRLKRHFLRGAQQRLILSPFVTQVKPLHKFFILKALNPRGSRLSTCSILTRLTNPGMGQSLIGKNAWSNL